MSNQGFLRNFFYFFSLVVFILAGSGKSESDETTEANNSGIENPLKVS